MLAQHVTEPGSSLWRFGHLDQCAEQRDREFADSRWREMDSNFQYASAVRWHRATGYSITSSVVARIVCGIVRPSNPAVFWLTTNSNHLGFWTGKSTGFAPLMIFPAYTAAWRQIAALLGPREGSTWSSAALNGGRGPCAAPWPSRQVEGPQSPAHGFAP
jgi:hypothetical protein